MNKKFVTKTQKKGKTCYIFPQDSVKISLSLNVGSKTSFA